MKKRARSDQLRARVASEAARLLASDQSLGVAAARRKAARRLGCDDRRQGPDNGEILEALASYQALFRGEAQPAALARLREVALAAMEAMARFEPRLVGPVLTGTADVGSRVSIRLFVETPEEVALDLLDRGIPWEESECLLRYAGERTERRAVYLVYAGETPVEFSALPRRELRSPPLDSATGRPEKGASLDQLRRLLAPDDD